MIRWGLGCSYYISDLCETPNPHWARVGISAQALSFWEDVCVQYWIYTGWGEDYKEVAVTDVN